MTTSGFDDLGPIAAATAGALGHADLAPVDAAAGALLLTYARELDLGGDLATLGPRMLRVLEALRMTPKARAVVHRGVPVAPSQLDELSGRRARKSSRQSPF